MPLFSPTFASIKKSGEVNFSLSSKRRDQLILFFIVLAVLLIRRNDAFRNPQLWAEDYAIYFLQMEDYGIKCLTMPYGGYLHFLPRLLAAVFSYLNISYFAIPKCYTLAELVLTYFIALNVWVTSERLNIRNRIAYSMAFLMLPMGSDIFMNFTNINWVASVYLLNFLFTRYTDYSYKYYYGHLLLLLILSLSGPFSTLLTPLIAVIFVLEIRQMTLKKAIPLAVIMLGGCVQLICMKFIDPDFYRGVPGDPEANHLLKFITNNMNLELFLRDHFHWLPRIAKDIISIIAFLALVIFVVYSYQKIDNKRKYILLVYAIISVVVYVKAYWPNESKVLALESCRYYFLPLLCTLWIIILGNDEKINQLIISAYIVFLLGHLRNIQFNLPDKNWQGQIQEYYDGKRTEIDINPEGWHFAAPKRNK